MNAILSNMNHFPYELNSAQRSIDLKNQIPLILEGPSGSGKTIALVEHLSTILSKDSSKIKRLFFLSPLQATVQTVNKSLQNKGIYYHQALTFEALCIKILRKAIDLRLLVKDYLITYHQFGGKQQQLLIDDSISYYQSMHPQEVDAPHLDKMLIQHQIRNWKSKMVYPYSRWVLLHQDLKLISTPAEHECKTYELIYEYYEQFRVRKKILDQEDIYLKTIELLYSCKSLQSYFAENLDLLIVDDFHELTALQYKLFSYFLNFKPSTVISLDPNFIKHKRLLAKLENEKICKKIKFFESFRNKDFNISNKKSIEVFANEKLNNNEHESRILEAEWICNKIRQTLANGYQLKDMAVLVPQENQIPIIEAFLVKNNISYYREQHLPFYLNGTFLDCLRCLRFAITDKKIEIGIYPENERDIKLYLDDLEVMNRLFSIGLTKQELENIRKKGEWFESSISQELVLISGIDENNAQGIRVFLAFIAQLKAKLEQPAKLVLSWLVTESGFFQPVESNYNNHSSIVDPLINICDEDLNCVAFMQKIYKLVKSFKKERKALIRDCITLNLIAESKGRQWDIVFISFPDTPNRNYTDNELLYTGVGRAYKKVFFSCSKIHNSERLVSNYKSVESNNHL